MQQVSAPRIVRVDAPDRLPAVERLLAPPGRRAADQARQFLDQAVEHRIALDLLWSMIDDRGEYLATVLAVPNAGRTAMVFATRPTDDAHIEPISRLIDSATARLGEHDVVLGQALLTPGDRLERAVYTGGGFRDLAELSYLSRTFRSAADVPTPAWPQPVELTPYDDSMRAELLDVLERSYVDTLDCPGLIGLRRTEDILEGHRASGRFDPSLWTVMRIDGRACGVVLLNPAVERGHVELVYLGLTPEVRGNGLGRALLFTCLRRMLAGRRRLRTVTLAVDDANAPARRLYDELGFTCTAHRLAMIRGPLRD